jgi:hypothetical protein
MDEEALRSAAILQRKFAKAAKAPEAHDEHMKNAHRFEQQLADLRGTDWETERGINEQRVADDSTTRTA